MTRRRSKLVAGPKLIRRSTRKSVGWLTGGADGSGRQTLKHQGAAKIIADNDQYGSARIYLGTFLIAFATLALEVALTRLLSVVTWYHLAFFAISTAMLGMTAAATSVYLRPAAYLPEELDLRLQRACTGFSVAVPLSLLVLCRIPLDITSPIQTLAALLAITLACALPFYYSGIALTVVLTKHPLPVARVYASDLVGASMGCLFVLAALEFVDVPSLILLCAAVGALAGVVFGWGVLSWRTRRLGVVFFVLLSVGALANSVSSGGIRPVFVKGRREAQADQIKVVWNSFSRVAVYKLTEGGPFYWGPSPVAPEFETRYHYLDIDGDAGTPLAAFDTDREVAYLPFDITSMAYHLRGEGGAAVIGIGGGRDIQTALLFGHEHVTAVEVNPIFVDLLENDFLDFARLGGRPDVTLVVDDARGYMSRTTEQFAVLQMSMIDTWAATGAGAYSHTENGLYTLEAWEIFLERLAPNGIFTVSRFHSPEELGETGRVVSLAVAALLEVGASNPRDHIAVITTGRLSTLLVGRSPFSEADIEKLASVSADLGFVPGVLPGRPVDHPWLERLVSATSYDEIESVAADVRLNVLPSTDDKPYFFNMLRLSELTNFWDIIYEWDALPGGVVRGNLIATAILAGLIFALALLTLATILVPLVLGSRLASTPDAAGVLWSGAVYFSMIGGGFMLVEIGMIQRLSVFLGHPVYALGILLFSIILSAGIGSLTSERLPVTRAPWIYLFPLVTAVMIVAFTMAFPYIARGMVESSLPSKIAVSILMVFPIGILLGFFFPTGMRLAERGSGSPTPWYWALNGVFGILFTTLAVFSGIHFGISWTLFFGALCYATTTLPLRRMLAAGALGQPPNSTSMP